MIRLVPIGKWVALEELARLEAESNAQAALIESAQEYIEDVEMAELEEQLRSKKREIEYLDDSNLPLPGDVEGVRGKGFDMVRWYAGPDEKSVRGQPLPHIEYADSKRKVWVRKFKATGKPFEHIPIEEPLESAPA